MMWTFQLDQNEVMVWKGGKICSGAHYLSQIEMRVERRRNSDTHVQKPLFNLNARALITTKIFWFRFLILSRALGAQSPRSKNTLTLGMRLILSLNYYKLRNLKRRM